ncbi:LysM peptidoglycan-binding domain-containing protein [Lacihabitans sp. CS3-21]|jgi:LysM repeat protein|uniref:LysM peptidoglycan-binding domain-containing protein n=1 Tax=Lacihabitans sp. CS3-21 TaxID=2487332 RepID=UPI0020CC7415|nr:LysM peptidoglycan-binding domain-containing protein [Lacihabitans sp. CS3-21]MCP9748304.1 LysM peptidoglycan-binding domain-containing protein [Lacihabitans sp. CS3-21]
MEFEDRNPKPETPNSGLPMAVLLVLVGIICLLLYAGWHLMSDDASKVTDLNQEPVVVEKMQDSIVVDTDTTMVLESASLPAEQPKTDSKEAVKENKDDNKPVNITGEKLSHTVKDGETFYGIANKFNVSANTLKKLNPGVEANGIKVGITKLIVPIQGYHIVGPGDILKVVAKKYDISVEAIMNANGKTKNFAERGEKLIIPRKVKE